MTDNRGRMSEGGERIADDGAGARTVEVVDGFG